MTTTELPPIGNGNNEFSQGDLPQSTSLENFIDPHDGAPTGRLSTSKHGTYNIVAKDFGDHQVNYYIPRGAEDDFAISDMERLSLGGEGPVRHSARMRPPRSNPHFDMYNNDYGYDYDDIPVRSSRSMGSRFMDPSGMSDRYNRRRRPRNYGYDYPESDYSDEDDDDDGLPDVVMVPEFQQGFNPMMYQQPFVAAPFHQQPFVSGPFPQQPMISTSFPQQPFGSTSFSQQPLVSSSFNQPSQLTSSFNHSSLVPGGFTQTSHHSDPPVTIKTEDGGEEIHTRHTYVYQAPSPPPPPVQHTVFVQPEPQQVQHTFVVQAPPVPPPPPQTIFIEPSPSPPPPPPIIIKKKPQPKVRRRIIVTRSPSPEPPKTIRRTVIVPKTPTPEPPKTIVRTVVVPRTPTPEPPKTIVRTVVVPRTPTPPRRPVARTPPPKPTPRKDNTLKLKDVVAQNRARRTNRPLKPKREVHEEHPYDLPTYHRDVITNGFVVYK